LPAAAAASSTAVSGVCDIICVIPARIKQDNYAGCCTACAGSYFCRQQLHVVYITAGPRAYYCQQRGSHMLPVRSTHLHAAARQPRRTSQWSSAPLPVQTRCCPHHAGRRCRWSRPAAHSTRTATS
jgi:hypothetical protein